MAKNWEAFPPVKFRGIALGDEKSGCCYRCLLLRYDLKDEHGRIYPSAHLKLAKDSVSQVRHGKTLHRRKELARIKIKPRERNDELGGCQRYSKNLGGSRCKQSCPWDHFTWSNKIHKLVKHITGPRMKIHKSFLISTLNGPMASEREGKRNLCYTFPVSSFVSSKPTLPSNAHRQVEIADMSGLAKFSDEMQREMA